LMIDNRRLTIEKKRQSRKHENWKTRNKRGLRDWGI
jgi:hypothetical protein